MSARRTLSIVPGIIALSVLIAWMAWPRSRDVRLDITGTPTWGATAITLGKRSPTRSEPPVWEFAAVPVRYQTLRLAGSAREGSARCAWEVTQDLRIRRGSGVMSARLAATPPRCPTLEVGYALVGMEAVPARLGEEPFLPKSDFLASTARVPPALWRAVLAEEPPCVTPDDAVGCATWWQALALANALSALEKLTPAYYADASYTIALTAADREVFWKQGATGYRLPTRAELALLRQQGHQTALAPEWAWDRGEEGGRFVLEGDAFFAQSPEDARAGLRLVRVAGAPP